MIGVVRRRKMTPNIWMFLDFIFGGKKKKSRERILTPTSHVALGVQEQLTTFNRNNPRLMLALMWYSASCCICMCLCCILWFLLFSFPDAVCSVGIHLYFSIQHNVGSRTIHSYCLASGCCRVKCHLPCISCRSEHFCFGYRKTNRRRFGVGGVGGYLSTQLQ